MNSNAIKPISGQNANDSIGNSPLSILPIEVLRKILAGLDYTYGTSDLANFTLAVGDDDIARAAIQSTCQHLQDDTAFLRLFFTGQFCFADLTKWLIANDWRGYDPIEMKRQIPVSTFTIATSDLNHLTFGWDGVYLTRPRYAPQRCALRFVSFESGVAFEGTLPAEGDAVIFMNDQTCCWDPSRLNKFCPVEFLTNMPSAPPSLTFTFIRIPLERRLPREVPLGLPYLMSDVVDVGRIQLRESNDGCALFHDFSPGGGRPRSDNYRPHFPEVGSFLFGVAGETCLGMPMHEACEVLERYHVVPRNPMSPTYGRRIIALTFLPQDTTSLFVYLQCAFKFGLTPIVRRFYEEKHIDIDARIDHDGNTALHLATQDLDNIDLIRYLLHERGANPSIPNLDGKIPVDLLCDNYKDSIRWYYSNFEEILVLLRPDGWTEKVQPTKTRAWL